MYDAPSSSSFPIPTAATYGSTSSCSGTANAAGALGEAVRFNSKQETVFGGPAQLKSLSTTERNALTAVNGQMIYNTTDSKIQAYAGSTWVNLH